MLSLSPRQSVSPHQSDCGAPCCLRPTVAGSASGAIHFRGHFCVHFRYGPMARHHPMDDVVNRLQKFGYPPSCYSSYGALTSSPVGLSPLNMPAFAGRTTVRDTLASSGSCHSLKTAVFRQHRRAPPVSRWPFDPSASDPPPSLHPHYRDFNTTTGQSAPVRRISTFGLAVPPLAPFPLASPNRFPSSTPEPR